MQGFNKSKGEFKDQTYTQALKSIYKKTQNKIFFLWGVGRPIFPSLDKIHLPVFKQNYLHCYVMFNLL